MTPDEKEKRAGRARSSNYRGIGSVANDTADHPHPAVSPLDEAIRTVTRIFPGTIDVTFNVRRDTWSPIPWNTTPRPGSSDSPYDRRGRSRFKRETDR